MDSTGTTEISEVPSSSTTTMPFYISVVRVIIIGLAIFQQDI